MIGIITLANPNYYNYGGVLQNYALLEAFREMGIEARAIHCDANSLMGAVSNWSFRKGGIILQKGNRGIIVKSLSHAEKLRSERFQKFIAEKIDPDSYIVFDQKMCRRIEKRYSTFVVGSDQVWNPDFALTGKNASRLLLDFTDKANKVSYAASFGVDKVQDGLLHLYAPLKSFDMISVREDSAARIVENITGYRPAVLLDPTLLLSKEKWESVSGERKLCDKPYVLKYYLGKESEDKSKAIAQIAKEHELMILDLDDSENVAIHSSGPVEFLALIRNASLVCTDSFHATVFSIMFSVPFLLSNRKQQRMENMGDRTVTLLKSLNLEKKLIGNVNWNDMDQVFDNDYSQCLTCLENARKCSFDYITAIPR